MPKAVQGTGKTRFLSILYFTVLGIEPVFRTDAGNLVFFNYAVKTKFLILAMNILKNIWRTTGVHNEVVEHHVVELIAAVTEVGQIRHHRRRYFVLGPIGRHIRRETDAARTEGSVVSQHECFGYFDVLHVEG